MDRQSFGPDDQIGRKYSIEEIRTAIFANPYCSPWPGVGQFPWPRYEVTLACVLRGIWPKGTPYRFLGAAKRTIDSFADLRWGPDGRGFRRLLHPNGICLFGQWEITEDSEYTGLFEVAGPKQFIGRYSTCCTEPRSGYSRSLSLVGKVYDTDDPHDTRPMTPAALITQEDLGGTIGQSIRDAELRNAPNTTFYRRGIGAPVLLLTGLTFLVADREPANRQLYELAELSKPTQIPTRAPEFMRLIVSECPVPLHQKYLDFRDEIMAQLYDPQDAEPKRSLEFRIEVSDEGVTRGPLILQRRQIKNWRHIGTIKVKEAVASYNGDHVIHFHHPAWRVDRNDPETSIRRHGKRLK